MTRRAVKLKYDNTHHEMFTNKYGTRLIEIENEVPGVTFGKREDGTSWHKIRGYIEPRAPYKKGNILYVRETWRVQATKRYESLVRIGYHAGGQVTTVHFPNGCTDSINRVVYDTFVNKWRLDRWYPSIHMPKEAARIFLRVTDVRVERLNTMTLDDFLAEGVVLRPEAFNDPENAYWQARSIFSGIWYSTIPKEDLDKYGWGASPWVWVIQFERVEVE